MADEDVKKDEEVTEAAAEETVAQEPKQEEPKKEAKAKKEEAKAAVPKEFEALIEKLDKMSAREVSKLVKAREEHGDVSAAAPAAAVAAAPAAGDGGAA